MVASFKSEAIEVLKKSKKPLKIKEITKEVLKRGNIKTKGATPDSTLYAVINEDIKKKGAWSAFIRAEASCFGLNPNYKEEEKVKPASVKFNEWSEEEVVTLLGQTVKTKVSKRRF